jgi:hypothetical protein
MIRFSHTIRVLAGAGFAKALNLFSFLRDVVIETRLQRKALETELFRGRYRHLSKNDDDLPIVR